MSSSQADSRDFYHDDPEDLQRDPKKKFSSILACIMLAVGGVFFVQTTLAANLSLNSGAPIEFGQGISATAACSGDSQLIITPHSSFVNASGAGSFKFDSVTVSGVPEECYGSDFTINAYGNTDNNPLAIFNESSTKAIAYYNSGVFEEGVGGDGMSVEGTSGSFTVVFAEPIATAGTVYKITLQSGVHLPNTYGISWASRASAADRVWYDIIYANDIFVAVGTGGTGERVMTSEDGATWISRTVPEGSWRGLAYGNGVFVAVGSDTNTAQVMTSSDGITWVTRAPAVENSWMSVAYGNGIFVAISYSTTGNRVMTSSDGVNWISQTPSTAKPWKDITFGNGAFVAVSSFGVGDRVMTSSDGITWTSHTPPTDKTWNRITFGNNLFVAVGHGALMTSVDGINWTITTPPAAVWLGITYGNGVFVAVGAASANRVMTSPDGITWTARSAAVDNDWYSVAFGNGIFVATSGTGVGNRVMTSIS